MVTNMNPFQHSPEAGTVYVLLEQELGLPQDDCAILAIKIVNQLRRGYKFVPLRPRNQPARRKW